MNWYINHVSFLFLFFLFFVQKSPLIWVFKIHIDFLPSHIKCFLFHPFHGFLQYKTTNVKSYKVHFCPLHCNNFLIYFFILWLWVFLFPNSNAYDHQLKVSLLLFQSFVISIMKLLCGSCFYSYIVVVITSQSC